MPNLEPSNDREIAEIVAWAAAEGNSLEILAGRTKQALGRPTTTDHTLDVSRMTGVVDYEPAELVLTARPGEPLSAIASVLAEHGQMLAFEPPDWRSLLGSLGEQTLGGVIACNLAGSRRVRSGSPRDYLLGFSAVNGFGELWKAGGKVVKNVTGYDMAKLQAGAFGTLSVLTELTVKVVPKPDTACTLVLRGLANNDAIGTLAKALNAPFEVSGAAHLPSAIAGRSSVGAVSARDSAATLLRLEGPRPSVAYRADALEALVGAGARLDEAETQAVWSEIGAVRPLIGPRGNIVWRVCPTPSAADSVARACVAALPSAEVLFDWGGGLIWLSLEGSAAGDDGGAAIVRAAVRSTGGHAALIVAPEAIRASTPVFQPLEGPLGSLSVRVKRGFDPRSILNPGRMQEGL